MTGGSKTSPRLPAAGAGPVRMSLRLAFLLLAAGIAFAAQAGQTLDGVKARGYLRCGVSEGIAGFSEKDATGRWIGFDADFCRAVAAAALGDAEKVRFVPLKASARFPALQARAIDLLARNTSWTMPREVLLRARFPAVFYHDGQAFMVAAGSPARKLADLAGAKICVEKGTTHEQNLRDRLDAGSLRAEAVVVDSAAGAAEALFSGKCAAYTSDASQLAAARLGAPGGPQGWVILPERISKEPLAPAVLGGDGGVRPDPRQHRADGQADARSGPAPAHRRRRWLRPCARRARRLGGARHRRGRQLRRDVRTKPRPGQSAENRTRPEPPVDRGRPDGRPAAALAPHREK